ncbi:hypothetical protein MFRU_005g00250 [Monilinia fructicola]|nr:hypothetical protein MFRU_005g00250 [Monilinia fructicola]
MSGPQRLFESMNEAGRKALRKPNRVPTPTPVGHQPAVLGLNLRDTTFPNATSNAEIGGEENRFDANQHIWNGADEPERQFPFDFGAEQSNLEYPSTRHIQSGIGDAGIDESTVAHDTTPHNIAIPYQLPYLQEEEHNTNNILDTNHTSPNASTMTDEEFERFLQGILAPRNDTTSLREGTMADEEFEVLLRETKAAGDAYTTNSNDLMTYEEFQNFLNGPIPQLSHEEEIILASIDSSTTRLSSTHNQSQAGLGVTFPQDTFIHTTQNYPSQISGYHQSNTAANHPSRHDVNSSYSLQDNLNLGILPLHEHNEHIQDSVETMRSPTLQELPASSNHSVHVQHALSSPMYADPSLTTNFDENPHRGYQTSVADIMAIQNFTGVQNSTGATQAHFERDTLYPRVRYDEYNEAEYFQPNDPWRLPQNLHDEYNAARASQHNVANHETTMGNPVYNHIEPSETYNDTIKEGNKKTGIDHRRGTTLISKKRADWSERPDYLRPRMSLTEEEYEWLRPGETQRDVFKRAIEKAEQKIKNDEKRADRMEREGKPRPKPKERKPIKGGVHISVEEKDRLNNRRRALGMSGRALFTERPKLRGKRRKRAEPELNDSGPEPKKQRVSGHFGYDAGLDTDFTQAPIHTNERASMETGGYAGFFEASATKHVDQGAVNSGSRYNTGPLSQAGGVNLSITDIQGPEQSLRQTLQGPNGYMENIPMLRQQSRPIHGISRGGSRGQHQPNSEQRSMNSLISPGRNAFPHMFGRALNGPGVNHESTFQSQIPGSRSKRYRVDDDESAGVEDFHGKRRRKN